MILHRVKISQKILLVITLALLVLVAFAIGTIAMGNSQIRTLEEVYSKKIVPLDNLRKIQLLLREIEYRMAAVAAGIVAPIGSGEHLKMSAAQIDGLWADVKTRIHEEGIEKEIEGFEKGYGAFKEFIPLLQEAYFNEDIKQVVNLTDRFYDFKPILYKTIDKMAATQEEAVKKYNIERTKTVSIINKAVLILSIVLVALFLFFGIIINRSISVPINNTVETIRDIAQGNGDLTKRLPVASKDEMGSLAEWFNVFIKGLHAMVKDILAVTGNVLTTSARIKQSSTLVHDSARVQMQALETTSSSLWEMSSSVKTVASAVVELHKFTEDASAGSTEMSTAVQEIANHAGELDNLADTTGASINQIVASIKEVSASIETLFQETEDVSATIAEMGRTIQEIGAYAKEQAIMSEKVKEHASALGLRAVMKTVDGMTRIREEVVSITEIIGSLGGMSKEIGKIVEVINGITDTTALLSLNASILAAQAGEHGKGFSVVAEEVRGLADRTALSTKEIDALIRQVQKQVVEAERSTKLGLERVEEGVQLSTAAERALKTIIESSTISLEMAKKIDGAIDEQTKAVKQVMANIQRVNSMVHEINKASKEQSGASDEILGATEKELGYAQLVRKSVSQQAEEINHLSKEIAEASQRMQSISNAMTEQEKTIEHIVTAVQTIMTQAEMNVKYAGELDGIVGDLAMQGGTLNKQVGSFKV